MRGISWSRLGTPLVSAVCVGVLVLLAAVVIGGRPEADPGPVDVDRAQTAGPAGIEFVAVDDEVPQPSEPAEPSPSAPVEPSSAPQPSVASSPTGAPVASPARPAGSPAPVPVPAPTTSKPPQQVYAGVTGYKCQQDATRGFTRVNRWVDDDLTGWYSISKGSWTGDGCDGSFDSMPMNGSATKVDYNHYVEWWFQPGAAAKTCTVSIYVPTPMRDIEARGKPAYYEIRDGSSKVRAVPTVDQWAHRASWVSLGTHAVAGGRLVIRLRNQGTDPKNEHLSVAPARVVCFS